MKLTDSRTPFAGRFHSHGDRGADPMHNEDVAHETTDVYLPAIVWSAVMVAATCIGTAILIYVLFFWVFEKQAEARDPKLSPLAMPATAMPATTTGSPEFGGAPAPRLLTNEPTYLGSQRQQWEQQLHGYGWIDQTTGVARIPIDEAKKLVLERGLPVRPDPVADPLVGTHAPAYGESSSGRTITKAVQ